MYKRRIFIDEELQSAFYRDGFVKVNLLSHEEVDDLYGFYNNEIENSNFLMPEFENKEYTIFSVFHTKKEFRKKIFDKLIQVLQDKMDTFLIDYKPILGNFIIKYPFKGILDVHQNAVLVDESEFSSLSVWCALQDTTIENGTLYFIKGSHLKFRGFRSPFTHLPFKNIQRYLVKKYMHPIEVKKGEAIILDDSIIHFSDINKTSVKRLSAHLILLPKEAPAYFLESGSGSERFKIFEVDESYFFNVRNIENADRSHLKFIKEMEIQSEVFTKKSFEKRVNPDSNNKSFFDRLRLLVKQNS